MYVTSAHGIPHDPGIVLHTDDAIYRLDYYHYHILIPCVYIGVHALPQQYNLLSSELPQ